MGPQKLVQKNWVPGNWVPKNCVPENCVPKNWVPENWVPKNWVPKNWVLENWVPNGSLGGVPKSTLKYPEVPISLMSLNFTLCTVQRLHAKPLLPDMTHALGQYVLDMENKVI